MISHAKLCIYFFDARLMCRRSAGNVANMIFFLHKNLMISTWMKFNAFLPSYTWSLCVCFFPYFLFFSFLQALRNKVVDWPSLDVTNWTYYNSLLHRLCSIRMLLARKFIIRFVSRAALFLCNYGRCVTFDQQPNNHSFNIIPNVFFSPKIKQNHKWEIKILLID